MLCEVERLAAPGVVQPIPPVVLDRLGALTRGLDGRIAGHRAGRPADHGASRRPERTTDDRAGRAARDAASQRAAAGRGRVLALGAQVVVVVAEAGAAVAVVPATPDVVAVGVPVAPVRSGSTPRGGSARRCASRASAGLAGPAVRLVAEAVGRLDVRPRAARAVPLLVRGPEAR